MEERLRSLASERQKLFNELFRLRNQLDEAEVNMTEKEEHIESLKQVMR
jgi:peptidoglycan hydrolase CwlO-like protein